MLPEVRVAAAGFGQAPLLVGPADRQAHGGVGGRGIVDFDAVDGEAVLEQFVDFRAAEAGDEPPKWMRHDDQAALLFDGVDAFFNRAQVSGGFLHE